MTSGFTHRNCWALLLLLMTVSASVGVNARIMKAKICFAEARTELENSYCELIAKGRGIELPDFFVFKENTPDTQWLLLRNIAQRAALDLPPRPKKNVDIIKRTENTKPVSNNTVSTAQTPRTRDGRPHSSSILNNAIKGCVLIEKDIVCNNGDRFALESNRAISELEPNVFFDKNRLEFPDKGEQQFSLLYLSSIYPMYIEKMLSIGLADSTMSFTKFNTVYEESVRQDNNFSTRFSDTFEVLKQERSSMAVKPRYQKNFPESIEFCMHLNDQLVACDNVSQNWVYKKVAP
jgi:hypothetical protein